MIAAQTSKGNEFSNNFHFSRQLQALRIERFRISYLSRPEWPGPDGRFPARSPQEWRPPDPRRGRDAARCPRQFLG